MKITIDTFSKTITVPSGVLLVDIFNELQTLLPNDKWKEYTLVSEANYFPIQPPYIQPYIYPNTQPLPFFYHTWCGGNDTITSNA